MRAPIGSPGRWRRSSSRRSRCGRSRGGRQRAGAPQRPAPSRSAPTAAAPRDGSAAAAARLPFPADRSSAGAAPRCRPWRPARRCRRNGTVEKLKPNLYRALIDEAHKNNLRVMAHVFALDDVKDLVRSGIDGFAHMVRDKDVDDELIALLKARPNVFFVETLWGERRAALC